MFIFFIAATSYYHRAFQRPQHLAELFAASGHSVLFNEVQKHKENQMIRANLEIFSFDNAFVSQYKNRLQVAWHRRILLKTLLFFNKNRYIQYLTARVHLYLIRGKVINKLRFYEKNHSDRIVFFETPLSFTWMMNYFKDNNYKIVYDLIDDILGFHSIPSYIIWNEKKLLKQADLVIATNQWLKKKAESSNRKVLYIPNAADLITYQGKRPSKLDPLNTNTNLPILGYIGCLDERVDWSLLKTIDETGIYQLVLVGPITTNAEKIAQLSTFSTRVRFVGARDYDQLPDIVKTFDIGIIPFLNNNLTRSINPIKAYEYLAAYKPVVSTCIPDIQSFPYVYQVHGSAAFISAIEVALKTKVNKKNIMQFLKNNTWEVRFAEISAALQSLFHNSNAEKP